MKFKNILFILFIISSPLVFLYLFDIFINIFYKKRNIYFQNDYNNIDKPLLLNDKYNVNQFLDTQVKIYDDDVNIELNKINNINIDDFIIPNNITNNKIIFNDYQINDYQSKNINLKIYDKL